MRVVSDFPHRVECRDPVWIPMPDGIRLNARLWLPESAQQTPVPAILEYIPYRLRDGSARRDAMHHHYFAGHGYASLRVDLRGSGDSEGVLEDEYLEQELLDGEAVLRWIAEQPWCDGNVGMLGISWGGFNGLQLAARRFVAPEKLGIERTLTARGKALGHRLRILAQQLDIDHRRLFAASALRRRSSSILSFIFCSSPRSVGRYHCTSGIPSGK